MEIIEKGAYEFDTNEKGIVIFTEKNIKLIMAMINNDSKYRKSFDFDCKDSSAGFLFQKRKFPEERGDLQKAVNLIDRENATHLSVTGTQKGSGGGCEEAVDYLWGKREDVFKQIQAGTSAIVKELSEKLVRGRNNLSFASKFCTYVSRYCFGKDCYSIVDEVLRKVLPAYEALYLGDLDAIEPKKWNCANKDFDYARYQKSIGDILATINKEGQFSHPVGRKEFDLFLWYYYKGSEDRILDLYDRLYQS